MNCKEVVSKAIALGFGTKVELKLKEGRIVTGRLGIVSPIPKYETIVVGNIKYNARNIADIKKAEILVYTKEKLEEGMVVELRDGSRFLLSKPVNEFSNGKLIGRGQHEWLDIDDSYREDLSSVTYSSSDIVAVYESKAMLVSLLFDDNYLEKLGDTKCKINWSEVLAFTKVKVRNSYNETWKNAYFIGIRENKFAVTFCDKFTFTNSDEQIHLFNDCRIMYDKEA